MHRASTSILLVALLVAFLPSPAHSQMPTAPSGAQQEAMHRLEPMIGHWEGTGWIMQGPSGRTTFTSTETVEPKLGGIVLLVEGKHVAQESDSDEPRVVHHALGLLSYDEQAQHYRFKTYLANGHGGDFPARLQDDGTFVWTMENPQAGTIRYTITLTEDTWQEIGEVSRDGETWQQFFEMTLQRVQPPSGESPE